MTEDSKTGAKPPSTGLRDRAGELLPLVYAIVHEAWHALDDSEEWSPTEFLITAEHYEELSKLFDKLKDLLDGTDDTTLGWEKPLSDFLRLLASPAPAGAAEQVVSAARRVDGRYWFSSFDARTEPEFYWLHDALTKYDAATPSPAGVISKLVGDARAFAPELMDVALGSRLSVKQSIAVTMARSFIERLADVAAASPAPSRATAKEIKVLTDAQIKHMANRFLNWKLPENFNPDGGISFKATFNEHTAHPMKHEPVGTNLLNATQAEAMVRHVIEGMPPASPATPPAEARELVERKAEEFIRSLAVTLVDSEHGYTMEFSASPKGHADQYDRVEQMLARALKLNRFTVTRASPASAKTAEDRTNGEVKNG